MAKDQKTEAPGERASDRRGGDGARALRALRAAAAYAAKSSSSSRPRAAIPSPSSDSTRRHHSAEIKADFEAFENKDVSVAGRMMSFRDIGKASFVDLQDRDGRIQVYVNADELGAEEYGRVKTYDRGDIIGVEGYVFKTRRGEISVHAKKIALLAKALEPLPEKYHGLKDTEIRYRRRYLDLVMNPEVMETFKKRTLIIRAIREYLDERGYIEVETPVLSTIASGAAARPFVTKSNALNLQLYLRIATELYLKRCIVGGMERVYDMGKNFRNEGIDIRHNPEFTMIELYQAYTDYNGMMELCEGLVSPRRGQGDRRHQGRATRAPSSSSPRPGGGSR